MDRSVSFGPTARFREHVDRASAQSGEAVRSLLSDNRWLHNVGSVRLDAQTRRQILLRQSRCNARVDEYLR
jgi:hypothetical protein